MWWASERRGTGGLGVTVERDVPPGPRSATGVWRSDVGEADAETMGELLPGVGLRHAAARLGATPEVTRPRGLAPLLQVAHRPIQGGRGPPADTTRPSPEGGRGLRRTDGKGGRDGPGGGTGHGRTSGRDWRVSSTGKERVGGTWRGGGRRQNQH